MTLHTNYLFNIYNAYLSLNVILSLLFFFGIHNFKKGFLRDIVQGFVSVAEVFAGSIVRSTILCTV